MIAPQLVQTRNDLHINLLGQGWVPLVLRLGAAPALLVRNTDRNSRAQPNLCLTAKGRSSKEEMRKKVQPIRNRDAKHDCRRD
jgi:hypothetical protein